MTVSEKIENEKIGFFVLYNNHFKHLITNESVLCEYIDLFKELNSNNINIHKYELDKLYHKKNLNWWLERYINHNILYTDDFYNHKLMKAALFKFYYKVYIRYYNKRNCSMYEYFKNNYFKKYSQIVKDKYRFQNPNYFIQNPYLETLETSINMFFNECIEQKSKDYISITKEFLNIDISNQSKQLESCKDIKKVSDLIRTILITERICKNVNVNDEGIYFKYTENLFKEFWNDTYKKPFRYVYGLYIFAMINAFIDRTDKDISNTDLEYIKSSMRLFFVSNSKATLDHVFKTIEPLNYFNKTNIEYSIPFIYTDAKKLEGKIECVDKYIQNPDLIVKVPAIFQMIGSKIDAIEPSLRSIIPSLEKHFDFSKDKGVVIRTDMEYKFDTYEIFETIKKLTLNYQKLYDEETWKPFSSIISEAGEKAAEYVKSKGYSIDIYDFQYTLQTQLRNALNTYIQDCLKVSYELREIDKCSNDIHNYFLSEYDDERDNIMLEDQIRKFKDPFMCDYDKVPHKYLFDFNNAKIEFMIFRDCWKDVVQNYIVKIDEELHEKGIMVLLDDIFYEFLDLENEIVRWIITMRDRSVYIRDNSIIEDTLDIVRKGKHSILQTFLTQFVLEPIMLTDGGICI